MPKEGRGPQAYAFLQKAYAMNSNNPVVRLKLAQLCLSAGKATNAASLAAQCVESDPTNELALEILIECLPVRQPLWRWFAARWKLWSRRTNPSLPTMRRWAGSICANRMWPTAEIELQTALRLDPKLSAAYAGMASVYSARKDLKAMEQALKTAADLSAVRSSTRLNYAEHKYQTGFPEEARQILTDMTRQAPDFIPAWNLLMKFAFAERKVPMNAPTTSPNPLPRSVRLRGAPAIWKHRPCQT